MPVLDLPLEELREYAGTNPKPADFDAFWDDALAEMRSVAPRISIEAAAFSAPYARCEHLYFTGTKGARLHAKMARPIITEGRSPALLMFHGYSYHSGDWSNLLPYAAAGFIVVALDCRGQGGASTDPVNPPGGTMYGMIAKGLAGENPHELYYRDVFLDCAQLAAIVMDFDDVDAGRIGASGNSQGGALAVATAALEPGIRRIAPAYPYLSDYRRVWDMDLDKHAYSAIREWFRHFDPLHKRENGLFQRLGYIDVHHLASRVRAETRMAITLLDDICPPSTQFAVYNHLLAQKNLCLYPDFAHERLPGWADEAFSFLMELG